MSVALIAITKTEDGVQVSDCLGRDRGTAQSPEELQEITDSILADDTLPSADTPDESLVMYEDVVRRSAELLKGVIDKNAPELVKASKRAAGLFRSDKIKKIFEKDDVYRPHYPRW